MRRIMVREGQKIQAGQVLLHLDDTQVRARIERLRAGIRSTGDQLRLVEDELGSIRKLYKQGYARKSRLMAFRRKQRELQVRLQQDRAELQASRDVVERLKIRAPMSGTIVGLRVHTRGGVIAPGAELLSIVPDGELLVIEARLDPNDIDVVHTGLDARVRLTPFSARLLSPVPGKVVSVSADRMTDEQTREGYYLARIELEKDPEQETGGARLYPGMPVEVTIVTGVRTLLDYLLDPLVQSFGRAFRES